MMNLKQDKTLQEKIGASTIAGTERRLEKAAVNVFTADTVRKLTRE